MTAPLRRERAALLGPLDALDGAVDRARIELARRGAALDDGRREQLELAAADVLRALVWVRRQMRAREHAAVQVLDDIALRVGAATLDTRARARRAVRDGDHG